jgi:hypothetical protein
MWNVLMLSAIGITRQGDAELPYLYIRRPLFRDDGRGR